MHLIDILLDERIVPAEHLFRAVQQWRKNGGSLAERLVRAGLLAEDTLYYLMSRRFGASAAAPEQLPHDPLASHLVALVPRAVAAEYAALPLAIDDEKATLTVAMIDPSDTRGRERVRHAAGCAELRALLVRRSTLWRALEVAYGAAEESEALTPGARPITAKWERPQIPDTEELDELEELDTSVSAIPGKVEFSAAFASEIQSLKDTDQLPNAPRRVSASPVARMGHRGSSREDARCRDGGLLGPQADEGIHAVCRGGRRENSAQDRQIASSQPNRGDAGGLEPGAPTENSKAPLAPASPPPPQGEVRSPVRIKGRSLLKERAREEALRGAPHSEAPLHLPGGGPDELSATETSAGRREVVARGTTRGNGEDDSAATLIRPIPRRRPPEAAAADRGTRVHRPSYDSVPATSDSPEEVTSVQTGGGVGEGELPLQTGQSAAVDSRAAELLEELLGSVGVIVAMLEERVDPGSATSRECARLSRLVGRELGLAEQSLARLSLAAHLYGLDVALRREVGAPVADVPGAFSTTPATPGGLNVSLRALGARMLGLSPGVVAEPIPNDPLPASPEEATTPPPAAPATTGESDALPHEGRRAAHILSAVVSYLHLRARSSKSALNVRAMVPSLGPATSDPQLVEALVRALEKDGSAT